MPDAIARLRLGERLALGVLSLLRRVNPIFELPGWVRWLLRSKQPEVMLDPDQPVVVVLRRADLVEVLDRSDVFSVRPYEERLREVDGLFMLGLQPGPQYDRERTAVLAAFRKDDLPRIELLAHTFSRDLVDGAMKKSSRIDAVQDLANRVPTLLAQHYFGLPEPEPGQLFRWFQQIHFYFLNFWTGPPYRVRALRAGREFAAFTREVVERRKAAIRDGGGSSGHDDFLERLLKENALDDEAVARNLSGMVGGSMVATIGLFVRALDRLLDLPREEFTWLQEVARRGDDEETIRQYVIEAARFNAYPPAIQRLCEADHALAEGRRGGQWIRAGSMVVTLPYAAAFDPEAVDRPSAFRPGRPADQYLLFGQGQHWCIGQPMAECVMTRMAMPLLALPGLRRAPGKLGRIQNGRPGVYPETNFAQHLYLDTDS